MGKTRIFLADSIKVGRCCRPSCNAVHIEMVDRYGLTRAQALVPLEMVEAVTKEMIAWRDGTATIDHPIGMTIN